MIPFSIGGPSKFHKTPFLCKSHPSLISDQLLKVSNKFWETQLGEEKGSKVRVRNSFLLMLLQRKTMLKHKYNFFNINNLYNPPAPELKLFAQTVFPSISFHCNTQIWRIGFDFVVLVNIYNI